MRGWKRLAIFSEPVQMKLDGFLDEFQNFLSAAAGSNATREVWNVRTPTCRAFLNDHHVLHVHHLIFETRLFQDIVRRTRRDIDAAFACNRDGSGLGWMVELAMTSSGAHQHPTVLLNQLHQLSDLHGSGCHERPGDA